MSSQFTTIPPPTERRELISAVTKDAAKYLNLDLERDTPSKIVQVVDETIVNLVFGRPTQLPKEEEEERDLLLGSLWGAQMVREFDWEWSDIFFEQGMDVAVISPTKNMAIYPFSFVADCIQKRCICTVELSFNMLKERRNEPVFEPEGLENVMSHIQHIVPPYTLEPQS